MKSTLPPVSAVHFFIRLMQRSLKGKVTGVDYSSVSVEKSKKVNADAIDKGRCNVLEASVSSLPFKDNSFIMATAFVVSLGNGKIEAGQFAEVLELAVHQLDCEKLQTDLVFPGKKL